MIPNIFKYNKNYKPLSRNLRRNRTDTEKFLWYKLRNRSLNGYKFYRQFPISNYVLDFYCPEKHLAIELDGGQHLEGKQLIHDQKREFFLRENNIKTLRFLDNEVFQNMEGILEIILNSLR